MSNFWATQLGTAPAPQPQPVNNVVARGYAPSPFFTPSGVSERPVETTESPEGSGVTEALLNPSATGRKALSAKLTDECPECGSGNVFRPHGHPNMMQQCYECGWNPRFAQMTAGGGLPSGDQTQATPARQMNPKGVSNFHPETIVAKVSV